jgi:CRP-like cAMP-binding protein
MSGTREGLGPWKRETVVVDDSLPTALEAREVVRDSGSCAGSSTGPPNGGPVAGRGNRLLDGLVEVGGAPIDPWLKQVRLRAGQILEQEELPAAQVIFPETAIVSLEVESNGRRIQAALVGHEGVVGAADLVGARAGNRAVVQFEGDAWAAPVADIARCLALNPGLRDRVQEAVNGQMMQLSRTLLATGHATIEQRVARFLLMAAQRIDATSIPITHGTLAGTLGVRRAGVTVALHLLEGKQAVRSERKCVRILDRTALVAAAGGFYRGE